MQDDQDHNSIHSEWSVTLDSVLHSDSVSKKLPHKRRVVRAAASGGLGERKHDRVEGSTDATLEKRALQIRGIDAWDTL